LIRRQRSRGKEDSKTLCVAERTLRCEPIQLTFATLSANNGSGGMFALSLRIAQPLARENAIFGGGHLSPLRFAERFQHFKDMIGKLSLSAFRPP
jgi:hypothetical protein